MSNGRIQSKQEFVSRLVKSGGLSSPECAHLEQIQAVTPGSEGCEDCLKIGDRWMHLRLCLTCGYVGCCDSSKNKHASKHFKETGHPLVLSYEPREDWIWCYADEEVFMP